LEPISFRNDCFYELYDELVGETLGYYRTIQGAIKAMGEAVTRLAEPLARDWEMGDKYQKIDFALRYRVESHQLKD